MSSDNDFSTEAHTDITKPTYPPRKINAKTLLTSVILSILIAFSGLPSDYLEIQPTYAVGGGMACVANHCSAKLSQCLSDPKCAQGLGCFMGCAAKDAIHSNQMSEGSCQVRCMDLYQNKLLDDFTDCSLTENHCYDALKADTR